MQLSDCPDSGLKGLILKNKTASGFLWISHDLKLVTLNLNCCSNTLLLTQWKTVYTVLHSLKKNMYYSTCTDCIVTSPIHQYGKNYTCSFYI